MSDRRDLPGYWAQGDGMHFPEARSPGHAVRLYREAFGRSEVAVDSGKTVDGLEVPALRRKVAELEGEVRQADRLAEKRVEGTVRRQFDARAGELQRKAERLEILAGQLREQRRALDDEWEKCKATQRESGLTPPWSLPVAVRQ